MRLFVSNQISAVTQVGILMLFFIYLHTIYSIAKVAKPVKFQVSSFRYVEGIKCWFKGVDESSMQ